MNIAENEHVVVRTAYPGQALRITLVQAPAGIDLSSEAVADARVEAELVIAPNHRLVVENGGVRVEVTDG